MTAKVRIKAGLVEFEYEAETELAVSDIKDLFTHIETLFKVPALANSDQSGQAVEPDKSASKPSAGVLTKLHVNSIATQLQAKSAPEVAIAAAASLQIYDGKDTFTRSELLDVMKKATMHYNANMSKNLSSIISTLLGKELNQISDGVYSLKMDARKQLEAQLA